MEKEPFHDLRQIVRPGPMGRAQVKDGYPADERDAPEKLQYDSHLLRRQTFAFALKIVGRTPRAKFVNEDWSR